MSSYTEQINELERQINNNNNDIIRLGQQIEEKREYGRAIETTNDPHINVNDIINKIRFLEESKLQKQTQNNRLNEQLDKLRNQEEQQRIHRENKLKIKQQEQQVVQQPVVQLTLKDLDIMIKNKLNEIKNETDKDKLYKLNKDLANLRTRHSNMKNMKNKKGGYNSNINYKRLYLKYKSKYLGLKNKN